MFSSIYAVCHLIRYAWSTKDVLLLQDLLGTGYFMRALDLNGVERATLGVDGSLMFTGSLTAGSRQVLSGASVTMTTSDFVLLIDKTAGSPTTVNLPAVAAGKMVYVVDQKGDAATNPITVKPSGGLINLAGSYVLSTNGAWGLFLCDGTNWIAKTV